MTESSESDDDEGNQRGFSSLFTVPYYIFYTGAGPAIDLPVGRSAFSRAVLEHSDLVFYNGYHYGLIAP